MSSRVAIRHRETGMSEVVGFVLIMGLITVAASLYLTYGVPAQGRENEIVHMNEISDQFVSFKLNLDSLYTNDLQDTTLSNTFTLGTKGAYSTGQSFIVPLMNPIASGGIMAINQRSIVPETLNLTSDSYVMSDSSAIVRNLPVQFSDTPSHLYINISGIQSTDLSANGKFGVKVSGSSWAANINLTPRTSFYQWYKSVTPPGGSGSNVCTGGTPDLNQNGTAINIYTGTSTATAYSCLVPINAYSYNGTDLTVSVTKGSVVTMADYPVYRSIAAGPTYTVDLFNDAYGLRSSVSSPESVMITPQQSLGGVTATGNITYDYAERSTYAVSPIALGAVEFRSVNNYWINQKYYYQMGGIVLSQADGGSTFKHPPEIGFSYAASGSDPSAKIVTVTIDALTIDQNDWNLVGGNGPIQVKSSLEDITHLPYAPISGNTRQIRIAVNTSDPNAGAMWRDYFNSTANAAGIPGTLFEAGISKNESYILFKDNTSTPGNDITVKASTAVYSARIHGT